MEHPTRNTSDADLAYLATVKLMIYHASLSRCDFNYVYTTRMEFKRLSTHPKKSFTTHAVLGLVGMVKTPTETGGKKLFAKLINERVR